MMLVRRLLLYFKHTSFARYCSIIYSNLCGLIAVFFYLFRIFPIDSSKIVVMNNRGNGYYDHPKYICEELLSRNQNVRIVWIINPSIVNKADFPDTIKLVRFNSLRSIYELSTAKVWIDTTRKGLFTRKRKEQYYIQTWHGFGPKKMSVNPSKIGQSTVNGLNREAKFMDLVLSNNSYLSYMYRTDFQFVCDILECGFPRNDIFFKESTKVDVASIKERLSIDSEKKIVMYAPTYRIGKTALSIEQFEIDYNELFSSLKERFGGDWVFLIRLHPFLRGLNKFKTQDDYIDVSTYLDMQELLYISDVLITDYSSAMFDFALTNRPCLLYTPDLDDYSKNGFCIQPDELPFPLATTEAELHAQILAFDDEKYQTNLVASLNKYGFVEKGTASKDVADIILQKIHTS